MASNLGRVDPGFVHNNPVCHQFVALGLYRSYCRENLRPYMMIPLSV